ncbi:MAG: tyrosine-protein phosphatase [Bacillota bacterium]|nr:tyrosine-protein phosphatase [Bacillota bacterium]
MKQSIHTPSIRNARELGGYVNREGKRIKNGLLLRTGKLTYVSDEDIDRLVNEFGVKKIFDFRTSEEINREPDRNVPGARYYPIRILDESEMNAAKREEENNRFEAFMHFLKSGFLANMYSDMFLSEFSQNGFSTFLKEVISCEEGAVLWHCSAGKDRTGMAAVLLLTILDFDLDVIVEDFMLTNEYTADLIEQSTNKFLEMGCPEQYREDLVLVEGVGLDVLKNGVTTVEREYGNLQSYIRNQLHITEEDITILKNRYLE